MLQLASIASLPMPVHVGAKSLALSPLTLPLVALFSWGWINSVLSAFPSMSRDFNHHVGLLLDLFQSVNVILVWERPKLDTILQMWSHKCWIEGKIHLPGAAGNTLANTARTLLAFFAIRVQLIQLVVYQLLFPFTAFYPLGAHSVLFTWLFHHRCKTLHLLLSTLFSSLVKPFWTSSVVITPPSQVCSLTESTLHPITQVINEDTLLHRIKYNKPRFATDQLNFKKWTMENSISIVI